MRCPVSHCGVIEWVDRKVSRFDCHEGGAFHIRRAICFVLFLIVSLFRLPVSCNENSISCGKCEQACPMHNIQMKEGKPEWGVQCSMCFTLFSSLPETCGSLWKSNPKERTVYL